MRSLILRTMADGPAVEGLRRLFARSNLTVGSEHEYALAGGRDVPTEPTANYKRAVLRYCRKREFDVFFCVNHVPGCINLGFTDYPFKGSNVVQVPGVLYDQDTGETSLSLEPLDGDLVLSTKDVRFGLSFKTR